MTIPVREVGTCAERIPKARPVFRKRSHAGKMVGEGGGSVQSHAPSRTAEAVLRRSYLGRSSIIDPGLRRERRTTAGDDVPGTGCPPAARGAGGRRLLPAAGL